MASKVTRDHHNLRRNLRLNDKFLSNDGGDEGIKIADNGNVQITGGSNATSQLTLENTTVSTHSELYVKASTANEGSSHARSSALYLQSSNWNGSSESVSSWIAMSSYLSSKFHIGVGTGIAGRTMPEGTENGQGFTIDSSGNIGIGTSSPGAKLHISGDGNLNGLIQSSSTVSYVQFQDSDTGLSSDTNNGTTIGTDTGAFLINNREDKNIQFATNDATRVTITNDGNVGIGTVAPEATLHLKESTDDRYVQRWTLNNMEMGLFGDATNHTMWLQVNSNDHFAIKTNATERMRILQGGNVGIGTTSPSYMLDVAGDISLSGDLRFGSGGVVSDGNGTIIIKDSDGDSVFLGIQSSGDSASNADAGIRFMESTNYKWNIGWDGSLDEFVMTDHSSGSLSSNKKFIFEKEGYLSIINEENDANGGRLKFIKDKGAAGADNDEIGVILFNGDNDAQQLTDFAKIVSSIDDASDGTEDGTIEFYTMDNGTLGEKARLNSTGLGIGKTPTQALDVNGKINTNDDIIISTSGKVLKNTGEILALQSTRYVRFGAIGGSTLFEVDNTNSRCDINVNTVITGNLTVTGEVNFDTDGLTAAAGSGSNVDVSIGKGTSSTTTIAGNIAFNGTDITSVGSIKIEAQSADITLDSPRSIALDTASSSGGLRALHNGTEYSVGLSAYAGMILGYRMIGEDAGHSTEILTTSFAVVDSAMNVKFIAPPSGNVEVMVQIFANSISSNRTIYFGLSDNATYNSIGASYEQTHRLPDETDDSLVQHYWTITGLTTGNVYNYWFGAKASATNSYLNWGGTSSLRYPDFIMKVTALPLATTDYAEYD